MDYRSNYDLDSDPVYSHELGIFKPGELRSTQMVAVEAQDRLARWRAGDTGFLTGLVDLDKIFRLRNRELITIGAMSSMGKTVLAMQFVQSICEQIDARNEAVAVFSAEMTGDMLLLRMASAMCGLDLDLFQIGGATDAQWRQIDSQVDALRTLPIWWDDSPSPTSVEILNKVRDMNQTIKIRSIMFDFAELAGDENDSEERRIGGIFKALKATAKKLDIPVMVVSQLNDEASKRANKMPGPNDIRYSRTASHITDAFVSIVRPKYYVDRNIPISGYPEHHIKHFSDGLSYIPLLKNRNGKIKTIPVTYLEDTTRFVNCKMPFN